jgi:hypothetical protein
MAAPVKVVATQTIPIPWSVTSSMLLEEAYLPYRPLFLQV